MELDLVDELFLVAVHEVESMAGQDLELAGQDLELAESVPWLRKMARQGADAHAQGKLQVMATQPEREAWASITAGEALVFWGPDSPTWELTPVYLRVCAELHTWNMPGLGVGDGPLHELVKYHIQAVVEAILFAFAEHVHEHYDW